MKPSRKTLSDFFTKPIVLACVSVILVAALYALWAVAVSHPEQGKTSAMDCTPSATLVNPCRPWVGAASGGYTQAASGIISQLSFLNQRLNDPNVLTDLSLSPTITHKIDIAHIYKNQGDNLLSSGDRTLLANSTFPYVMINWKPMPVGFTWKDACGIDDPNTGCVDNTTVDDYIRAGADALRDVNKKVFLTPFHEPENDVSEGNCTTNAAGANMGSPAQYVAMWTNIQKIFKQEYAATGTQSNVVWVMNFMGFDKWNCLIPLLWPGNNSNNEVDWIVWDSYGSAGSGYTSSIDNMYNFLKDPNHKDATHDYLSEAWGLNEFGYGSSSSTTANEAGSEQYWIDALGTITGDKYPLLKMYNVFDTNANGAHSQVGMSIDGGVSVIKQNSYNAFANAIFAKETSAPTADTTPPNVTISTPGSGTTLTGTVAVAATASDNIGVTDVKFYADTTLLKDDTTVGDGWSLQWNTAAVPNGTHTLKAVAYDAAGNNKTSSSDVVVNNPILPAINSFTASPSSIASGGSSTLSWTTANTTSCTVTPVGSAGTTSTSWQTGALTESTTFTLTCGDGVNAVSKTTAVTVVSAPTISSFTANPSTVTANSTSMLSWSTTGTSSCSIGPNGPTGMTTTSWQTLNLTTVGTTTYTLTCKNSVGASTSTTTDISVMPAPTAPTNLGLTASANVVPAGGTVTISWTSVGSDYCTLYPGAYKVIGTMSSKTFTNFQQTTTYYLNCYNAVGKTVSKGLTVSLGTSPVANPIITSFSAYPNPVAFKGQSTLSWSTDNVSQGGCSLAPSRLNSTWPNGQYITPHLTKSTTYTLTCKNSAGTAVKQSLTVRVSKTLGFSLQSSDMQLAATHFSTVASTANGSGTDSTIIRATARQVVVDASKVDAVPQNSLVTLDPATVTDSAEIAQITRLEYYSGSKPLQTVTHTPFALNSRLLSVGAHNITERVYFKDGSMAQTSQLITIKKAQGAGLSMWWLAAVAVVVVVVLVGGPYALRLALARNRSLTAANSVVVPPPDTQNPMATSSSQQLSDGTDDSSDQPR